MNIYEVIALIAEPDADTRLESIQRLARDALLPKPGTPQPRVTNFEKALTIGSGQTQLLVDGHHKVLIDDGTVYKLYNSLPKEPTVKEVKQAASFTCTNDIFKLHTTDDDIVVIPELIIAQMYNRLPKPAPIPPNPAVVTGKPIRYDQLITMLDAYVDAGSSTVLRGEYKRWKKENM